jgi:hypothetical protein
VLTAGPGDDTNAEAGTEATGTGLVAVAEAAFTGVDCVVCAGFLLAAGFSGASSHRSPLCLLASRRSMSSTLCLGVILALGVSSAVDLSAAGRTGAPATRISSNIESTQFRLQHSNRNVEVRSSAVTDLQEACFRQLHHQPSPPKPPAVSSACLLRCPLQQDAVRTG